MKELFFQFRPLFTFKNFNLNSRLSSNRVLIMTVAFNNLETIKVQAKYLAQNISDKYQYIVGDNSTKQDIAKRIEDFCRVSGIGYVRILSNPYNGVDASKSHGIAVNWMYEHLVKQSNARYFGIIDHDIFPIVSTSIIHSIGKIGFYGHIQTRENRWYLWPGFSFFDRKKLGNISYNFLPVSGLDTGGGNWELIYQYADRNRLNKPKHYYIKYRDGDVIQNTSMERIGDWLHLMNASGWKDGETKKDIATLIESVVIKDKTK